MSYCLLVALALIVVCSFYIEQVVRASMHPLSCTCVTAKGGMACVL